MELETMAYFTLIIRRRNVDNEGDARLFRWGVEFGDYDWEVVDEEQREFRRAYGREFMTKIVRTKTARQSEIETAVATENARLG